MKKNNFITTILPVCIYPAGDVIAQFILHEFNIFRTLTLFVVAALVYRVEIPKWFNLLDKYKAKNINFINNIFINSELKLNWVGKTVGAVIYFNPLWIARHMFIIKAGETFFQLSSPVQDLMACLNLGVKSFIINLPLSFIGNYIVQTKIPLSHRFLGSVTMTGIFAIVYALYYKLF